MPVRYAYVKKIGSVPFSMKADEGGLWNNERGRLGKEVV
jgi:hypothetical protein